MAAVLAVHERAPLVDLGSNAARHRQRRLRDHLAVGGQCHGLVPGPTHRLAAVEHLGEPIRRHGLLVEVDGTRRGVHRELAEQHAQRLDEVGRHLVDEGLDRVARRGAAPPRRSTPGSARRAPAARGGARPRSWTARSRRPRRTADSRASRGRRTGAWLSVMISVRPSSRTVSSSRATRARPIPRRRSGTSTSSWNQAFSVLSSRKDHNVAVAVIRSPS